MGWAYLRRWGTLSLMMGFISATVSPAASRAFSRSSSVWTAENASPKEEE
jgi:hypothetical protein